MARFQKPEGVFEDFRETNGGKPIGGWWAACRFDEGLEVAVHGDDEAQAKWRLTEVKIALVCWGIGRLMAEAEDINVTREG